MSKHTFEFKKNSIADWIGRDLSVALRGGVKSNSSPKAFIAASAFVTFLAVSPISHAEIENNGQPIFINGIYEDGGYVGVNEEFRDSNASFNINIAQIAESAFFGVNVTNGSTLTMDPIKSLNIHYSDTNTLDKDVNGLQNQLGSTTTIAAQDDVNISIKASTSAEIQGIVNNTGRGVNGDLFSSSLSLSSTNGSINVNVANDDELAASNIHGLNNGNGGIIKLEAKENINISASVAVSGTYNNLTALTNSGSDSTANLTAGGYISLNSKGNGSSIAIANLMSSNLQLTSQGKNDSGYGMEITSETSGVNSYAIVNQGSIYLQALNEGIHLAAAGGTDVTRALYSYNGSVQLIADSDIFLEARGNSKIDTSGVFASYNGKNEEGKAAFSLIGKSITIEAQNDSGVSYGVYAQESDVDINADYFSKVNSSTYGLFSYSVDKLNSFNLNLTSSSNFVEAGVAALYSSGVNSNINLEATGLNSVIDEKTGENLSGKNIINSQENGVWTQESGKITLSATDGNYINTPSYAVLAQTGEILLKSENGLNKVEGANSYGTILTIGANSVITLDTTSQNDSNLKGSNYVTGITGFWAQGGTLNLNAVEGNYLDVSSNGLFLKQSGAAILNVTNGVNRIEAGTLTETEGTASGSASAIELYSNSVAELNSPLGNNEIFGTISIKTGNNSKLSLNATNNLVSATKDTVSANSGLISIQAKANDGNSGNNFIYSKYANGYGEGVAIQALSKGSVDISAQETNSIFGAISSKNEGSSVSVDGKTNTVRSYAVISNAGNLNSATDDKFKDNHVISALYAEGKGAEISLTGEQNYLSTLADSSVHTDLERVVWAYDGADINIDGFTSITTDSYEKSLNSIDIAIAAGTAVNLTDEIVNKPVEDRAQVQIKYANTTDSEGKAVLSSVTGDILSAYAGTVNIAPKSASDGLVVTGNLLAGNNGELTVDIGANGVLTGRADDYGDAGFITDSEHTTFFDPAFSSEIFKGGQVNLRMGDNARWNVTGQSWITDISVADGAKNVLIDLVNANTDRNSTAHALTIYNLKGNATFNMSLDGNRDVSDMLYIRNANGEYNVNVVDAVTVDDMYKGGLNGLRFATVGAGSKAKFRAFTYDKGALNVEYEVATDSYDNNPENDIYNGTEMSHEKPGSTVVDGLFGYEEGAVATLALNDEAATQAADGTISETTNFKLVDRKDATPSDSGKTIIDHARANYANAVQLDTLNKRQGEMRFSQGHEDGLWARIRHDDIGKRSSFRLDHTMVEVGVDSRYVKETGEFHTGVAFDYMNGDTDYHHISGEGDLDRYGVWFYTTWLGNEGDYTDFIIKCSLIDNEYKIYAPTTGEKITGDYDNNVISVSLEHGKKYSNEESWFIEPQAQLQYAYVTSAEYTNSQGTDVRLDGIHSLIGRVGVRAGKDVTRDNPFTFYARGDIMHEFMGKQDIKAKDATGTMRVRYENDDTWYSAGLGMSYLHNKDKYYFLEAEKVFGGSNTSSYIVSGGVRFFFD